MTATTIRSRARRLVAAMAGTGALAGSLLLGPAPSAAPLASDWTEIVHGRPSGQDTYLYDVWISGDDEAGEEEETWAVGMRRADVGGTTEFRTWAQRCLGGSCTATYPRDYESPPFNTSNSLQSVSGTSSSDVWAVGYARIESTTAATTHHFDGTTWTAVPNPVSSGALYGVSAIAVDDVWAVGAEGSFAPQAQVVLHWNGTAWSRVPFTVGGDCVPYDYLRDVAADGRRPVVIGECRVGAGPTESMIATYKNGRWVRQPVAGFDTDADLSAVAWVGRQAWVSGSTFVGGGDTLTARWRKGQGWAAVSTGGLDGNLRGIAGASRRDVWAVGLSGCCYRLALHWDGESWTPDDAGEFGFLESVATSASGVPWAVGQKTAKSLIIRYDGPLAGTG